MRTAFIEQLIVCARRNPLIFLVVGDLGFSVIEPFVAEFPERFLNVGIAEQNMTGVAAGLASEGFHVYTYSIGNFPTLRCLEQIRNDVCYHNLPVTVVAVGAGMAYGNLGYSHHCVQDFACLRGLPNLNLLSPADPGETRACVEWLSQHPCPSYLRLGKAGEARLHSADVSLEQPVLVRDRNSPLAVAATGSILSEAIAAADLVDSHGIKYDIFSCVRISPLGKTYFDSLNRYSKVLVVEEHVAAGGLGEMLMAGLPRSIQVQGCSVSNHVSSEVGSQQALRQASGLDAISLSVVMKKLALG